MTPLPPFSGHAGTGEKQSRSAIRRPPLRSEAPRVCLFCPQPTAPVPQQMLGSGEATTPADFPGLNDGPISTGFGNGPLIPGALAANIPTPIEMKKPEPTQHATPRHMSEGVMEAALIHKVQPQYPAAARLARVSGTVQLRAIIGPDGRIRELEVTNGSLFLQAAAVAAVREWRYRPTLLNGEAVEVETLITVRFILDPR